MKFIPQHDQMDCGPACLAMVASHYGKDFGLQYLHEQSYISKDGVSMAGISEAAEKIGFGNTTVLMSSMSITPALLPCILHWNQNHFVVLTKVTKGIFSKTTKYHIADPSHGFVVLSADKFNKAWLSDGDRGVAMLLHPTEDFYKLPAPPAPKLSLTFLLQYLKPHRKQIVWLFVLLLAGTLSSLVLPLLTQQLIDNGVTKRDLSFVVYILLAQLSFFMGSMIFEIFRNWIMLTIGTKINIRLISDFLKKLLKLPVRFFDSKKMGDFSQRIQDHERIEQFLTSQSLLTLFSMVTFTVFFAVLWYYDVRIVAAYVTLTLLSIVWSLFWMRKRKMLDYFRFQQRSDNQESIYEIISGTAEMKLNQYEDLKRKEWESIQQKLYKVNIRILKLNQVQVLGFEFINQIKNIMVVFLAASFVIADHMTLGALLSVSYIIGEMNSPVNQLLDFFKSLQDARLSLSRLNEVQHHPEEETVNLQPLARNSIYGEGIVFDKVSFQYEGPKSPKVLADITFIIPEGKVTAIVGASGSGKTTLLKLLLRFYNPVSGTITYNKESILQLSPKSIRENCGVVMQDGYIFSDTIERNIATGEEIIDYEKLNYAINVANIKAFIKELPLGFKTKIGAAGNGISGGQRQRILIARAVYKNPHYIFLDEATSSLDADNEKIIHNNLQSFLKGKTVVIVAHRLSTVKNADQIIVLKKGKIVEQGTHSELVEAKSEYYHLVKNQLELGN